MIIPAHIRVAYGSLRSTRVRTGLTTLGIVIGVASITLVLALGEGAKQAISRQVAQLGDDIIIVKPGRTDTAPPITALNPFAANVTSSLTERDLKSVSDLSRTRDVAPLMILSNSIAHEKDKVVTTIVATNGSFSSILGLKASSGQFIDDTTSRDTVVLGQHLALRILGTNQARGQQVTVKGRTHTVVGVLRTTATPLNLVGVDLDNSAFVSLEDGKSFNQGVAQIQQLIVAPKERQDVPSTVTAIDAVLIKNHAGEKDYSILAGSDISQSANSFYTLIVAITATVATISLVVGGIGIMNIMLVSVIERTREIGIRKAVGATNRQIFAQFLTESLAMTLAGGLIGVATAYALAFAIGSIMAFQPAVSWQIIVGALGLSTSVGVLFGLFPAIKASRRDPIEALRQYQ